MRKLLLPLLFFFVACNSKQDDKKISTNENTDYLITMEGIGAIKTGMPQHELEKLLNKPIPLSNPTDTISGSWEDSAVVKYKEAEFNLGFVRSYTDNDSFYMRVTGMKTSSDLCKTNNGIGIGSSKQQIIDAFENYMILMAPEYEDTTYTTRSKTRYSIKVRESYEGGQIIFYLTNNKVSAIEVGSFYDDSE